MSDKKNINNNNNNTQKEGGSKPKNSKVDKSNFTKLKVLGKGDTGKVFLVKANFNLLENLDKSSASEEEERFFAMKVLDKAEMLKRNKVRRVLAEREILVTVDHPFIVTLYYSFQSETKLYFVMDYCAGGELYSLLQKQPHKCLKEEAAKFYAAEVLLALEYLHINGFIYRDLKPENILVHASGHIMLADFDLSKASTGNTPQIIKNMFNEPAVFSTPTILTTSLVGTAEYLAPEVISGTAQSSAIDWWTFGILLYEMVYGYTPFRAQNQDIIFSNISKGKLDFPENSHPYPVSAGCKKLIKALLAQDPKKRLGAKQGAVEVKKDPWFKGVNFTLIRNQPPPIKPQVSKVDSSQIFHDRDDLDNRKINPKYDKSFSSFTSIERGNTLNPDPEIAKSGSRESIKGGSRDSLKRGNEKDSSSIASTSPRDSKPSLTKDSKPTSPNKKN